MRRDVFLTTGDRRVYLGLLLQYSTLYSLRVLGYCLMSNHVHLIVVPTDARSMSRALREVSGRYAQYRNTNRSDQRLSLRLFFRIFRQTGDRRSSAS
jgi:putative transposase